MLTMTTDDALTPLASLLLETLRSTGGAWLTRQEIAGKIGRPARLTPRDVSLLNELVRKGLVEVRSHPRGPIQMAFIYRAKG